jgi:trehalose 6-phosphate synthase/phosphatase
VPSSPEADADAIVSGQLPSHRRIALLLDYDGTLVPFAATPDEARPDVELLNLLAALGAHPSIDLHLVTGRSIETANRWFWHLSAALWAEHGAAYRLQCDGTWHRLAAGDPALLERAIAGMEEIAGDTPGAFVERKTTSAAWHYRRVEPARAAIAAAALRRTLRPVLAGSELELLDGHKVIEVRPRRATKRRVAEQVAREAGAAALVVAIGDDETDEQMFEAVAPPGVTIRVGDGKTGARYHLADPPAVRAFLARLLGTGPKQRDTRAFRLQSSAEPASQAHG